MPRKSIATEELLRLVKELPAVKKSVTTSEVESFCAQMNVKSDIYEVPSYFIYNLYLEWSKQFPNKKTIDIRQFFRKFNQTYERKMTKFNKFYYCNLEPFNLTVETHSKLIKEMKNAENKKSNEGAKRTEERRKEKATEEEFKKAITEEVVRRLEEKDNKTE